jgi:prepilin-type N-terminal cleavage/methylation domain-containing protein
MSNRRTDRQCVFSLSIAEALRTLPLTGGCDSPRTAETCNAMAGQKGSLPVRLIGQAGYTLVETLVVMSLLVIVIGSIADAFSSASKTEVDQTSRASDQESARLTVQRLRRDIHCASSAQVQQTRDALGNPVTPVGYTLSLAVDPGICLAVTTSASNTVQWCTVQKDGAGQRFGVYRTISGNCNATDAVFQVDYVTTAQIWSMVCPPTQLQAVAVNMPVNRDPIIRAGRTYTLQDTIALRNDSVLGNCSTDT